MPIYAYECKECGVRFDRRQSFSDDPITICPECGGEVHRLIQPAGIIFKGSGFYVTDNRGSKSSLTTPSRDESRASSASSSATSSSDASKNTESTAKSTEKTDSKKSSSSD